MDDRTQLQGLLRARYPERWVQHLLATFPAAYIAGFGAADVERHLELMIELTDERPVTARARPAADGEWWVDVVGYDAFQFLSTLCNLLAVRGLTIVEGQVFTSQAPSAEPPSLAMIRRDRDRPARPSRPGPANGPCRRRKIVDVFRVRRIDAGGAAPDWGEFQAELSMLTRLLRDGQYEEVHHRLIGRFVVALGRDRVGDEALEPIELAIEAPDGDGATEVRIGARDSLGFLYLTASALALCGIRIVQADIRTAGGRVADTLWVTDRSGRPIAGERPIRELRLSLILIEHFSRRLPRATDPEAALVHFSRFATETMARPDWAEEFAALDRPEVLDALVRVLGESHFLWEEYLRAQPENLLPMIGDPAEWDRRRRPEDLAAEMDAALATVGGLEPKGAVLRRFRDREIFRADIRSILGRNGGPDQFSAELTDVAEVLLRSSFAVATAEVGALLPTGADGRAVPAVLCALGKCGGRELGFASDLELMLIYDDRRAGEADGIGGGFDRLVTVLRSVLAGRRGGTFEVDFRLRPHGRSGAPATALTTFADYYRAGGASWGYERQALIKLRVLAGEEALGREVEALRDRFVYGPEPFDLEGCRRMRRLQVEQLVRPGTINGKYSPGALVDVEYFVQALQIAHGGRVPALRTPNTQQALAALGAAGRLAPEPVEALRSGYRFFRALVDALRVAHGLAKDLTVPRPESEEFVLLARRMRRPDPARLQSELDDRIRQTRALADRLGEFLFGAPA
jgi:glutamate-ammonia-ligase adenylyltransferase